jgi:hypothetical protein
MVHHCFFIFEELEMKKVTLIIGKNKKGKQTIRILNAPKGESAAASGERFERQAYWSGWGKF